MTSMGDIIIMNQNTLASRFSFYYSINILFSFQQRMSSTFLKSFFSYPKPEIKKSIYTKAYVHFELKLILEIWTRAELKMYTDSKTSQAHFICKKYGGDCFHIKCEEKSPGDYVIVTDFQKIRHLNKCQYQNEGIKYIEIYNLMKLKAGLIEEYMQKHDLMNDSPSVILGKISEPQQSRSIYFFDQYFMNNQMYKRTLRKRFDNIVNIDIKKISKKQFQHKKHEIKEQIYNENQEIQNLDEPAQRQNQQKGILTEKQFQNQRQEPQNQMQKAEKTQKIKLIKKVRKIAKHKLRARKFIKNPKQQQNSSLDLCLALMKEDLKDIYLSPSSSESEIKNENDEKENFQNMFDLFQSLRSSLLQKSLQKQSLSTPFISMMQQDQSQPR